MKTFKEFEEAISAARLSQLAAKGKGAATQATIKANTEAAKKVKNSNNVKPDKPKVKPLAYGQQKPQSRQQGNKEKSRRVKQGYGGQNTKGGAIVKAPNQGPRNDQVGQLTRRDKNQLVRSDKGGSLAKSDKGGSIVKKAKPYKPKPDYLTKPDGVRQDPKKHSLIQKQGKKLKRQTGNFAKKELGKFFSLPKGETQLGGTIGLKGPKTRSSGNSGAQ